ncbi:DUF3427 domain-containing protein [Bacillus sp. FJAT-27986]|uniref:DUF3427 domain-containing protein n=1 Tax=Bacillus sp. FJAT-27986 TaxID=1743146 RepID=UPI0020C81907|nr:DUF3427 domain-containing protein [Bacillus sp. FJAT-27986]
MELYGEYNREEVHDIFDPLSPYTPGAGTWGIHGIVKIPNREKDYVFFVTFGQSVAGHDFEEEITEEGVLTWQSQPRHKFSDIVIQNLINHNHLKNNIYLFLRTKKINQNSKKSEPFRYLGKLAYISHDIEREAPVYFKWQLLDWSNPSKDVLQNMGLKPSLTVVDTVISEDKLVEAMVPKKRGERIGIKTNQFKARHVDFAENTARNKNIGLKGELAVLEYEKSYLISQGRNDLATKVIHTSIVEGDGAGYDIQSFMPDGSMKFIEVKTTVGGEYTPFNLTINELAFSEQHPESYVLVRIYDYDLKHNSGKFYVLEGDIKQKVELQPIQFKVKV